ncbi:MAG: DUF1365 family protein [Thermoleophilia bacterium]|nr:DUF1365 family protein [Thermoleophilia bacterium]
MAAHMPGEKSPIFVATQQGTRSPITRRSLLVAQLKTPLMSQRITALIHWQAFQLWRRKVRFRKKPAFVPHQGSAASQHGASPDQPPQPVQHRTNQQSHFERPI